MLSTRAVNRRFVVSRVRPDALEKLVALSASKIAMENLRTSLLQFDFIYSYLPESSANILDPAPR
jgi:hypothetical protein